MATFAEDHAHHAPAGTGNGTGTGRARVVATKWTIRYIDSGQASSSFAQCVNEHGDLHMIEELWTLIKAFMVMSDEDMEVCRRMLDSRNRNGVVVRSGMIVPCLYFTNIFNSRALTTLDLSYNQITDISAIGNALNTNSTLTDLSLYSNQVSSEDKEVLRKAWKHGGVKLLL